MDLRICTYLGSTIELQCHEKFFLACSVQWLAHKVKSSGRASSEDFEIQSTCAASNASQLESPGQSILSCYSSPVTESSLHFRSQSHLISARSSTTKFTTGIPTTDKRSWMGVEKKTTPKSGEEIAVSAGQFRMNVGIIKGLMWMSNGRNRKRPPKRKMKVREPKDKTNIKHTYERP